PVFSLVVGLTHTRHHVLYPFPTRRSSDLSGRLATKSNQIKQLIRNGRSASLQRTFKKSFTSFSHSTRNKTRDGLIRVKAGKGLQIGRAVQQECRDRSRMPSSA